MWLGCGQRCTVVVDVVHVVSQHCPLEARREVQPAHRECGGCHARTILPHAIALHAVVSDVCVAWRGQFWQASLRDAWPDPSVWVPESTLPRHTTAYRASHSEDRGWRAKLAQVRAVSPLAYLRCHRSCPYSCDGGDALFSCGTPACRTWVRRMIEVKNAAQLGTWIR